VAEWRAAANAATPLICFGTPDEFMHEVGSQEYARAKYGLTPDNIATRILAAMGKA
jgi:transketolase